jgi:hypothetical protein
VHGKSRASTKNFTLGQVIKEYSLLRLIIFKKLKDSNAFNNTIADIIFTATELGILTSATEFSHNLMEVQKKVIGTLSHDIRNSLYGGIPESCGFDLK